MTKNEYKKYTVDVENFYKRTKIDVISEKLEECPECGEEDKCDCGVEREYQQPYFSNSYCDICGSGLGGDRYDCTGYSFETKQDFDLQICSDCRYYHEYGQLDDMTEMDLEDSKVEIYINRCSHSYKEITGNPYNDKKFLDALEYLEKNLPEDKFDIEWTSDLNQWNYWNNPDYVDSGDDLIVSWVELDSEEFEEILDIAQKIYR